ncbi:MAG: hypothetical protein HQ541_05980 [Mariniphaga sp.]|nr:hypothetical protein [Mariniphaga sp.]
MNKLRIVLFLFIIIPYHSYPQPGDSVTLEFTSLSKELEPGKIHSLVFKINNITEQQKQVQPYLSLPRDLKLISELRPRNLKPREQNILIISFNIPAKYKAGNYGFSLKLINPTNPVEIITDYTSEFTVKEEANIVIELIEAPEFVKAGELIEASYVVRNFGNTTETISLASHNCIIEGNQKVRLAPGMSTIIHISSETDINLVYPNRRSFNLEAKCENIKPELVYGFVRVIPINYETNDLYHRFPVTLTSRYIAKGRERQFIGGYQFEAKGEGSIDQEGIHKIEFIARGPNQFDLSLLGLYDEYFFSYSNKTVDLKIGDYSYEMTPLTEYARYGSGFEAKVNVTNFSQAGIMYVVPRFYDDIKNEYGVFGNINFYKENTLGVHFLKKTLPNEKNDVELFSITTELFPFEKTSLEFEASRGKFGELVDNAYRFNINSQFNKFSLSSFYFNTGKNYPGYYTNSNFYSGFLNYQALSWLSVGISGRQDFINAEIDTLYSTAPFSRYYQAMVNLKIAKRMFLKSYVRQYERKDRSPLHKFHYESRTINSYISHKLNKIGYRLEGEYGITTNFLLPEGSREKNTFRGTGHFFYQPNQKHNFQGFVTYTNINSFISEQQNNWIFGITASSNITRNLRAYLHIQNTYSIEEYYRNRNLLQFNLDYQFLKNHKISLNSFYTIFQDEVDNPDYSLSISYSINFGIPLKQIAEAGSISGTLLNEVGEKAEGIILLTGGQTAITDENGNFYFKNLKPGKYNLLIDRSTLEIDDIPDIATPIELTVEGNIETIVNFKMTKAAKILGTFIINKSEEESLLFQTDDVKIGHIVMELHRDNESIRIISDQMGNFNFPLVRPGKWFLKIYGDGIDKQYQLVRDYFDFELKPGVTKNVKIEVQKRKRNIRFINNSINLSSGDN